MYRFRVLDGLVSQDVHNYIQVSVVGWQAGGQSDYLPISHNFRFTDLFISASKSMVELSTVQKQGH